MKRLKSGQKQKKIIKRSDNSIYNEKIITRYIFS